MQETELDSADVSAAENSPSPNSLAALVSRYRQLPRNVIVIGLISLLNDASSEIIYPLLPLFLALTLGASPQAIGLIEGAAESISSLLKLFAGYYSDRLERRKPLVVFGYALAGLTRPLLAVVNSWPQVLALRLTDRTGKGIRAAPRDALIADAARPEQRGLAFGFHRAMDHTGAIVGPLIAYAVLLWAASASNDLTAGDYRKLFFAASVPALLSVLVAVFALKEPRRASVPRETDAKKIGAENLKENTAAKSAKPKLTLRGFDANFKRFLFLIALFTLSNSSDAFLLLRARVAGVSEMATLLLWSALHGVKVLTSLIGGDLSDRLGRKTLIAVGWLVYAAVYAGFAFVKTPSQVWFLFLVYGIYFGLSEGVEKALVADLVRPEQRGTAFGLYNLAFGITVLPASLLMGALWNWQGAAFAFLFSASLSIIATLLLVLTVETSSHRQR
jgi:MFS family permease